MFKLKILRLFIVITFVAIVGLPLYSIFVAKPLYTGFIVKETEKVVENIARQLSFHLVAGQPLRRDNLPADFIREINRTRELIGLWKIKLYTPNGEVIYSTDSKEIGGFTRKSFFPDIIRKGENHTLLGKKGSQNDEGKARDNDVVETYVPIINKGKVTGVFEMYYDITKSHSKLARLAARANLVSYLIATVLGIMIITLAIKAGRGLVREQEAQKRLKRVSAQLADLEEAAKRRIAIELHDRVGQKLTALNLNLNIIKTRFARDLSGEAETFFSDSFRMIEESAEEVRDIMSELRPNSLDDHGLAAALRWFSKKIAMRSGLEVEIREDQPGQRLAQPVETALFRIAQESLTNVVKHAMAHSVMIRIEEEGRRTRMTISDDGIGFTPEKEAHSTDHLGIIAMRERATAIGAELKITSSPGQGTTVTVEV